MRSVCLVDRTCVASTCHLAFGLCLGGALLLVTDDFVKLDTEGTCLFSSSANFYQALAPFGPPTVTFY